jgi:hypothetical protein
MPSGSLEPLARRPWPSIYLTPSQSQKIRAASGITGDRWEAASPFFKANPRRTDDVEVNRILRESLRQMAMEAGIDNVTIVAKRWEEAELDWADVVISAHVIYMIEDLGTFIVKMVEHARDKVFMPTFIRPPMARYAPFWRWVHDEDRAELPGAAELMQVLWDMDIYPNVEMFEPIPFRAFKDWQTALEILRQRLHVTPDTAEDARLQKAIQALLMKTPNGYAMQGTAPGRLALISWRPR